MLSAPKKWEEKKPLSIPRKGLAVVPYENQIYAIAGENSHGPTDIVEKYDPNVDTWQTMNPKPTTVSDVNAVVIGGKIYVPGGKAASGKPVHFLIKYYTICRNSDTGGLPVYLLLKPSLTLRIDGKCQLICGDVFDDVSTLAEERISLRCELKMIPQGAHLIIDVQLDFCHGGALAVPQSDAIIPVLNKYIKLISGHKLPIFASRDWHFSETKHFKQFGGGQSIVCKIPGVLNFIPPSNYRRQQ